MITSCNLDKILFPILAIKLTVIDLPFNRI